MRQLGIGQGVTLARRGRHKVPPAPSPLSALIFDQPCSGERLHLTFRRPAGTEAVRY